jgi:hypothetical protein
VADLHALPKRLMGLESTTLLLGIVFAIRINALFCGLA